MNRRIQNSKIVSNAKFPCGQYGRQKLEFYPAPFRSPLRAFAALVFPWHEEQVLLCNICDRGWCIPSGRVEPNESSLATAGLAVYSLDQENHLLVRTCTPMLGKDSEGSRTLIASGVSSKDASSPGMKAARIRVRMGPGLARLTRNGVRSFSCAHARAMVSSAAFDVA